MKIKFVEIDDKHKKRVHLGELLDPLGLESNRPVDDTSSATTLRNLGPGTIVRSKMKLFPLRFGQTEQSAVNVPSVASILNGRFDEPVQISRQAKIRPLRLSTPHTLRISNVEGTLTNLGRNPAWEESGETVIEMAFVGPSQVNAATVKALARRENETLLRKVGDRWEPVSDDDTIDLRDTNQVYRLGKVEIYS